MIDLYEKNAARATTGNTCWIYLFISRVVIGEAKSPGKREAYRVKVKTTVATDRFRRVSCSARGPYASVNCPLVEPHRDALNRVKARAFPQQSGNRDLLVKGLHSEQCNHSAPWVGAKYAQEYPYMSEKWHAHYGLGRAYVKKLNMRPKMGYAARHEPRRCPSRGFFAQLLYTAF